MQLSPTLCRPRHLDTERLRARLGSDKFEKLRYHEAAVVSTAPMRFQLFALSGDALFIIPLMSRREAAVEMCLSLGSISTVDRIVPATKKQRGLLLLPTSQLFRLQLRQISKNAPSELFFATFEPQTQLFFQLSRALNVNFQKQLMPQRDFADNLPTRKEQRFELSGLLETLAFDLLQARDDVERIHLLKELTAAASSSSELRQLFFEDRTQVQGCTGLACYLVRQLSLPLRQTGEIKVEFLLSIVRVLGAMCFDMQLRTNCLSMLSLNDLVRNLLARGVESFSINRSMEMNSRVLREELLDAQSALLLALDAMQQYEDFRLHRHQQTRELLVERSTSIMQHVLQAPALAQWLPKFFKRLCVAISRAAIAVEQQREHEETNEGSEKEGETDEEDNECREAIKPIQILALWRSMMVLELLVKGDIVFGDDQVLGLLLRTRKDYIDMYLRTPRFRTVLSTSGILHLEEVAMKINRFLESLRERRRG